MRAAWLVASLCLSLSACAKTNTVLCGEVTCPAGTHCGTGSECIPDLCGNDQVNDLEECDGNSTIDQGTRRCTDYGFYKQSGPLMCGERCTIDKSACKEFCGDNIVNGTERCDGIPPSGFACADFGFDVGAIGCADGCSPAFDFCASLGWQLVPGGGTDELYAVYLAGPSTGVAVGRGGQIIAARDGAWIPVTQTVTTEDLNGIVGTADGIIAVGNNGTVLRYDGTTITKTNPTSANLRAIDGGALGAIAVGDGGTILRFNGTSWMPMTSGVTEDLYGVHVVGPTSAYAVGTNGTVLKLSATGWSKLTLPELPPVSQVPKVTLNSVFVVNSRVFVAGQLSTFAEITSDTEAVVAPIPFDVPGDVELRSLWAASPTDVFIAGSNGLMLHWNGAYLTQHDVPTNRTIYGLDGVDGRVVGVTRGGSVIAFSGTSRHVQRPGLEAYAVYTDGTRTVAAGNDLFWLDPDDGSWRVLQNTPNTTSVFAVGDDAYLGSRPSGLFRSASGAALTTLSTSPTYGIWATSSRLVAVGTTVIESTDFLSSPQTATFPQTATAAAFGTDLLYGVWGAPDGIWYAVGNKGVIIRRGAGGWTALASPTTETLRAVWGTASDDVFVVGDHGTILHWNGATWRFMYSGLAENLVAISGNTRSDIFVTGTSFTRLHYDGISWSRMASYTLDTPSVSTYRGTTFYVSGRSIERQDRVMSMTETRCGDPFDNDADGVTNCDDLDCKEDPQCRRGGACETLERVTCETTKLEATTYTGVARLNDLPCLTRSTPGPEASYRYVAATSGEVTITIDEVVPPLPAGGTPLLDLVVTDALEGHCELDTCRPSIASGTSRSVTFTATAGQMYYIVVDGPVGTGAAFTLSVACN